ncbi:hypothetical protein NDO41_12690 [Ectopseudomonas mendocina]|nr:hypothetical protein NDO41_12690 [Pseudomonas mendocina]
MKTQTQNLQFMDGSGGDDKIALLLATDLQSGNYDFTRIFTLDSDGCWGHWDFDSVAVSVLLSCHGVRPERRYFALGRNGQVFCTESGKDPWIETISSAGTGKHKRGVLKRIRAIGEHIYACGGGGQVYRRDGQHSWTTLDALPLTVKTAGRGILCDIAGFSEHDLYVAGQSGRIFHYDGSGWQDVSPATNLYLESLRCASNGKIYVCGQNGLLLWGDKNGWNFLIEPGEIEDIWDIQPFKETLYVAADEQLMALENDTLVPVDTGLHPAPNAFRFSASNGILWSIGESDICCFDGSTWQRIVHPDNQP